MAYRTVITLKAHHDNDADFRATGLAVKNALIAMGWVQTGDTGQVDWSTVTRPGTVNTVAGYEIWRMADALQSTNPVFMKLEWGTGNVSIAQPTMWVQIATGSNGSGSLTGPTSTRHRTCVSSTSTSSFNCLMTGDTNRALVALFVNGQADTRAIGFSIEREVDANGNLVSSNGGVLLSFFHDPNAPNYEQEFWSPSSGGLGVEGNLGILAPLVGTGVDGFDITLFPQFHAAGIFKPAGLNLFGYFSASLAAGVPVTVTVYGNSHEYYPLGATFANNAGKATRGGPAGVSLLARYDA